MLFLLLCYVIYIPIKNGLMIYKVFYFAGENFQAGNNPYTTLIPGQTEYKYGMFFLTFPIALLSYLPELASVIVWQILNVLIYSIGFVYFFKVTVNNEDKAFQPNIIFILVFSMFLLFDIQINGVHNQSNGILIGLILIGISLFKSNKLILSGLVLAYATNMKLIPIIIVLLLFTRFKWKFIISYFVSNIILLLLPALFIGWGNNIDWHLSWVNILARDFNLYFGDWAKNFLSVRAFIESNFNISPGWEFNIIPFILGSIIGLMFIIRFRKDSCTNIKLMSSLGICYILLFNPRTEGPSLLLLSPVYAILFLGLYKNRILNRKLKIFLYIFTGLCYFTTSLSTTDITSNTIVNKVFWDHNLRTIGVFLVFALSFTSLFNNKLRKQIFD